MAVSSEEMRLARKAGFKRKKPKKPKSKTYNAMKGYIDRHAEWEKDLKAAAKKGREVDSMKKKVAGM